VSFEEGMARTYQWLVASGYVTPREEKS